MANALARVSNWTLSAGDVEGELEGESETGAFFPDVNGSCSAPWAETGAPAKEGSVRAVVSVVATSAKEGSMSSMAFPGVISLSPTTAKEGSVVEGLEESAMAAKEPENKEGSTKK